MRISGLTLSIEKGPTVSFHSLLITLSVDKKQRNDTIQSTKLSENEGLGNFFLYFLSFFADFWQEKMLVAFTVAVLLLPVMGLSMIILEVIE